LSTKGITPYGERLEIAGQLGVGLAAEQVDVVVPLERGEIDVRLADEHDLPVSAAARRWLR
jgi:hypothetical protein